MINIGLYTFVYIRAIDTYIFCDLISSVLFSDASYIFFDLYAQVLGFCMFKWTFLSEVSGFGKFAMKWSSNPHLNHIFGFRPLHSLCLLLEFRGLKGYFLYPFSFSCCLNHFSVGFNLHSDCTLIEKILSLIISYWTFQIQIINL